MLERELLGFINENRLFGPTDRLLLAVSGGLDSMVLAELFHRTGQSFAIAHVNFGMRGDESDGDAVFVQNKAKAYEVPFHLIYFDTVAVAAERGISIQMAARDLRYSWFAELNEQHGYAGTVTAHHKNDVLETLLLNLTRGTGLAGLHGIAARQERSATDVIIRPLLFATREQLADYAREHGILYREDRSNNDDKYARNRIRHHVVPVLAELNPGLWHTLPRTIERLRAAEALVRTELDRSWATIAEPIGHQLFLPANKLIDQTELAFRLAEWLKPYGFLVDQVSQMIESLNRPVGQVFASPTHRIVHDRLADGRIGLLVEELTSAFAQKVILSEWPGSPLYIAGQFMLTVDIIEKTTAFRLPTDPKIACLDADLISFPLTIRTWHQGDRFHPLGLNGHKLVSDLLNDLKLTRSEREQAIVLLSADQIVWVAGRRIDHRYRITAKTKQIARFIWQNK
ncbi:tRNA lysidine(34) synthetase TilS [Spirosoma aureum]|uniref:tRNA(Ile)-lysidine synthase n=1 Tax=Spirosoma aureum TaxID=2692134 RepID=A0A6G9AP27_9BACT|nr:tRNA lysidine(34) synthetase TilS [Spirosoma aureum]QIP14084.1 tRNA lysidine(34) synthetase TilS [Spirosoma aureum]